jgi:glutathione S-transferase
LPKYLAHFQNVLQSNSDSKNNGGTYLVGSTTTTADLVLFQVQLLMQYRSGYLLTVLFSKMLDGISYAFPKRYEALKKSDQYKNVFALKERVAQEPGIKEYLASDRRLKYNLGIFRHYEELDSEE